MSATQAATEPGVRRYSQHETPPTGDAAFMRAT